MKKRLYLFIIIFFLLLYSLYAETHFSDFFTLSGDIALTFVPDKNNKAYDLNKNDFYNPFSPVHVFLYPSLQLLDNLFVISEFLIQKEKPSIRTIGLFLVYSPFKRPEFNIKIGMFPTPFGTFSSRCFPHSNILIGYPLLMRQHQTGLSYEDLSENVTDLIQNKEKRHDKISPINEIYWDSGIQLFGEYSIFEYSFGITQGALSWPEPLEDKTPGKQIIGRVGLKPSIELRLGFSYARGNYFELFEDDEDSHEMPLKNINADDFKQKAYGFDYHFSKGYLIIQGEVMFSKWKSPPIRELLPAISFYSEVRYKLSPFLYIAGRYDELNFSRVKNEAQKKVRWDSNIRRIEVVLSYSIIKDLALKISYQKWIVFSSPREKLNHLAAQLNYHF